MSTVSNTPLSQSTGNSISADSSTNDLKDRIKTRVDKAVLEKNKYFLVATATIVVIIIMCLLVGSAFALRNYVISVVDETAHANIKQVKAASEHAQFYSEVIALNIEIQYLHLEDLTVGRAKDIIHDIQSLVDKSSVQDYDRNILGSAILNSALNFIKFGRLDYAMQLDDIASDLLQHNAVAVRMMIMASGSKLLGDSRAPASWTETGGSTSDIYKKYRKYTDTVKEFLAGSKIDNDHLLYQMYMIYLLYEMLVIHVEGRSDRVINILIEGSDRLDETYAKEFVNMLSSLATENAGIKSTEESRFVAARVSEFLCKYNMRGDLIGKALRQAKLRC